MELILIKIQIKKSKKRKSKMKYIFFFFALLAFVSGCAKTTKKSYEEGSSTIVRKFKKGEKNPAYTDEYYSKSEFIKCSYSFDDENKRVIVLGNKNFNAESDIVNQNGKDIKCIYFSMYDIPFEPSEYTTPDEFFDGPLGGTFIFNKEINRLSVKEIYLKINPDNTIELAGTGDLYEGTSIKIIDENFKFCYKGKVTEAHYTDLWKQ